MPPPATARPDRYADAVRARRAELRAARDALPGHRAELHTALALARLAATEELAAELARFGVQARAYLDRSGRRERDRFPTLVLDAAGDLRRWAAAHRDVTVRSAARRVAFRRGLAVEVPAADPPGAWRPPAPEPARPPWSLLASGCRTALLPAAGLPLLGLPVTSPSAVAGATGLGVAAVLLAAAHHVAAADRLRLRRWCDGMVAALRADSDTALARLLLATEQAAGAAIEVAAIRRRAEVDGELARLAPRSGPAEGSSDG